MNAPDPVDVFLERFARALRGGRRWRNDTVAEVRAHLLDALDDKPEDLATMGRIVERFGDPVRLAATLSVQQALCGLRVGVTRAARFAAVATAATFAVVACATVVWAEGQSKSSPLRAFVHGVGSADDTARVAELADAARRWTADAPDTGPGEPLAAQATTLLRGAGSADALRAFPTSKGRVCFEVLGAGTCGELSAPTPISMSILYTRAGGTRVFGVAADDVTRVQIDIGGALRDATLKTNGFYYQLAGGATSADVRQVISTTSDGQRHILPVRRQRGT